MFWSRIGGGIVPVFAQTCAPEERLEQQQQQQPDVSSAKEQQPDAISVETPGLKSAQDGSIRDTAFEPGKTTASTQTLAASATT
jgi:hypothetical protein